MKKYLIRVYITDESMGLVVNDAVDSHLLTLTNSFDGVNGVLAIYDGETSSKGLKLLISLGVPYMPLNHFEDFIITCPNCGERIDDNMLLTDYGENVLSGYNINCDREECGCQMAHVDFILD